MAARRTVVKAGKADFQPVEGRQPVLLLKRRNVHVVPFHPHGAHCLEPFRAEHLDVLPRLGDVAVLCAVDAADDEMGDVRGEIELDGGAHLRANIGKRGLCGVSAWCWSRLRGGLWTYALLGGDGRAT